MTAISVCVWHAPATYAEQDYFEGYKIKDLNQVNMPASTSVTNVFGGNTCELKRAQFFLVQSESNGGDDPLGGPAGNFVCYKAKCSGPLPPVTDVENTPSAALGLETKKAQLVCLPVNPLVCGDGEIDAGEACDGGQLGACTLGCNPDCTCTQLPCEATTGGYCWFLANTNQNCDDACADTGRVYDPATATYAGSSGTDANCTSVMNDMGVAGAAGPVPGTSCGCCGVLSGFVRFTDPTTSTCNPGAGGARACACQ
jgi:hypothetical protein